MLSQTPLLRDLAAMAGGTSRKRRLPRFARQPFTRWYRGRKVSQTGGKKVLLYPDVFNDCFHPEVLRSAVSVLERWGYQVIVPGRRLPALRPLLHYGMLTAARRKLRTALARLEPHIADGVPLIFLEPSTASVFRDEIDQLIPDDPLGMRASRLVHLLDSFVLDEGLQIPRLEGKAVLHVHCHEKAVFDRACQQQLLTRMGLDWEEPQEGCCGMAGSFGFEAEHFDLSREIAEQKLLPAVRNTDPSTYLVADGFSCKTQISQGAGRTPLHTAQLLEMAFQGASR